MATINIYISRNGNSKQIKLRDSEGNNPGNDHLTTTVNTNDTIQWQLDSNSGLQSLEGVKQVTISDPSYQPNTVNLLVSPPPPPVHNVTQGTVVPVSPGKHKVENYKIGFTIPGDSTVLWDDPKLKINN